MDDDHTLQSDADLVCRSRHDPAAFGELYRRHAAAIHRYHQRCTRDPDAAHDLTAETFAQAWLAHTRFHDGAGGSAAPWLYGIARNVLLMSVRRRRIERTGLERLGLLGDPAAVSATEQRPDESWLAELEARSTSCPKRRGRPCSCASGRTSFRRSGDCDRCAPDNPVPATECSQR